MGLGSCLIRVTAWLSLTGFSGLVFWVTQTQGGPETNPLQGSRPSAQPGEMLREKIQLGHRHAWAFYENGFSVYRKRKNETLVPAATLSQAGTVLLRQGCGLLLLKSCQLSSGQTRGLGIGMAWSHLQRPAISLGCAGGHDPAQLQGRGLW